jgi:hypothetical protein
MQHSALSFSDLIQESFWLKTKVQQFSTKAGVMLSTNHVYEITLLQISSSTHEQIKIENNLKDI